MGQLSIVGYFDFYVVYVIFSFSHHLIITLTEIYASPNEEEKEQEISFKEFMKTQKQFMEKILLVFQKHATTQSSEPYRSRTDEKDSNDASQLEIYGRDIYKKMPGASTKRKRVNQGDQNG